MKGPTPKGVGLRTRNNVLTYTSPTSKEMDFRKLHALSEKVH